ncbi:restriction endonuclease subunit S [Pseudomonas sp. NPDC077382]
MSFPAYPDYKHSGIELLPEYPSHWALKRFKNVFEERAERSSDGSEELLSVSAYFGVKPRSETLDEGDHLSRAESLEGYKVCRAGDLVINIMLAWNRGLGFSWQHGIVSPAYSVFHVTDGSYPKFLDYLVRSDEYIRYFKTHSAGIMDSRLRLYPESFGRLFSVIPPACEQTQIARFLDHETARIDALIEEQQRLIELLKEKRQAVISHAVTKGLDPTVPMKDSGVEWLGEVPAHWEVGSLRRLIKSVGNGTTADQVDEAEDTVAVSRIETISAGLINFEKVGHVGPQDVAKRFLLNVGDILFSHINSLSMIGNVAIYSGGRPLLHGMNLLRIQPLPSISSEWLLYWLKSKNVRQEVESRAKPAINQASISTDSVRALPALIPPSFEQTQIARFLDYETARIDALIEEANSGVGLLQERRSALISAVVTGKIDVRGWQPPANIQAPESAVAEAV